MALSRPNAPALARRLWAVNRTFNFEKAQGIVLEPQECDSDGSLKLEKLRWCPLFPPLSFFWICDQTDLSFLC